MKLPIIIATGTLTAAIAYNAYALTCGAQPSCDSLGYKYTGATTDCVNTPLKCPFNSSYFNCVKKVDALKNMSLDWDKKVSVAYNTPYTVKKYGCIWGNIIDNGNGTSRYTVNGTEIRASMQAQEMSLIFTCLAPNDTILAKVGKISENKLYFIPYKGN